LYTIVAGAFLPVRHEVVERFLKILRMSFVHKLCSLVILLAILSAGGCSNLHGSGSNNYTPKKFDLVIASESEILDAAYEALLEVYPYTLFFPLLSQQPGYYWRLEYWDIDPYYDYNSRPGQQYEFRLKKSHGYTPDGTLMSGYRYEIISYGMGYINDIKELHHLDIVFRSELFQRHIESIEVAEMVSINRDN
jgi:hypothetical protein